jgi:phage-related protein|nr:MAG TPA: distal tail protein [Caudoviricetes sp.]
MRAGFSFNGKHSSVFGIDFKTKNRPMDAEMKTYTEDTTLSDGELDFSESNPYHRAFYKDRIIDITLYITSVDLRELQKKLSRVATWLRGSGELIFDDMPYIIWDAKITGQISYAPKIQGRVAEIDVSFRVRPMARCIFDTEGPSLDDEISLDENLPIGMDEYFTSSFTGAKHTMNVLNVGTWHVRPVITLECASGINDTTLSINGNTLGFIGNGSTTIEIDCQKQLVTGENNNLIGSVTGTFFELKPGDNELTIIRNGTNEFTVEVSYTPYFVYDTEFDLVDWDGEENA